MSRIALTGGGGFVGRHLVPLLAGEGHQLRALARPGSSGRSLPPEVEVVSGDVRSAQAVRSAVGDAEVVIHLAASFSQADSAEEIVELGTRNVISAASEGGAGRIIFLSCLGADAANRSPFYAAKWKAEQLVRGSGLPYVILRPSLILGQGDRVTAPLATLLRRLPAVPMPGSGTYRQQPVDVEDVARCIQLSVAGDDVLNQEISLGGATFLTYREMVDLIAGQLGVLKPKLSIPITLLPSLTSVLPSAAGGLFCGPRLAQLTQTSAASPGIISRTFGFEPRDVPSRIGQYLG